MLAIRSLTLDLDGTLLDTVFDLAAAANLMLQELGLPLRTEEEVRCFVGRGIPNLVQRCVSRPDFLPDAAWLNQAVQVFKKHYAVTNGHRAVAYPGVIEGLDAFAAMGLPMACITNKAAAFAEPLLVDTGLAKYFRMTISGDSLPEKKPHPLPLLHVCQAFGVAPALNLHIGDSKHDVGAAKAAGCPVFCLPYGYNEGGDVRELDCDAIVPSLLEAARRVVALPPDAPTNA